MLMEGKHIKHDTKKDNNNMMIIIIIKIVMILTTWYNDRTRSMIIVIKYDNDLTVTTTVLSVTCAIPNLRYERHKY